MRLRPRTNPAVAMLVALASACPGPAAPETQTRVLQQCGLGSLECVAYSPNGRTIVTAGSAGAYLRNAETGEVVRRYHAADHRVRSVALSPDGTRLLTGGYEGAAKLWNVETGQEIRTFRGHTGWLYSVAFHPDGTKALTGSGDDTAKLWDAETGQEIRTFSGPAEDVWSVAFSPDGAKIATGGGDGTVKLWDAETGQETGALTGHAWVVSSVAFSPDGSKILTGSYDLTARLWDSVTGAAIATFGDSSVLAAAFSPDGTAVLTGGSDRTAKLWSAETGHWIRTFSGHFGGVRSVAFSPDGARVLTGSGVVNYTLNTVDNTTRIWDTASGQEIRTFGGHTTRLESVAFAPDGTKILTGSTDYTARLWDAATGAEIRTFSGYTGVIWAVALSPDGTKALTGGGDRDATAKMWGVETGREIREFLGHTKRVYSVAFSPDGTRVLTGSADGTAKLWNAETGDEIRTFPEQDDLTVFSAAFSPDGGKVLTAVDWPASVARLWDAQTGELIRTFAGHELLVHDVAFSPDGTKILTGGWDDAAKLWNTETAEEIRTFSGHAGDVQSVAFSPDGAKILTGSSDKTAKLWDAETGEEIQTFSAHADNVPSAAFSRDGSKALTGSWDGTAIVWEINPPRAVIVAGGGDYPGNGIARQTNDLGAYAYKTLKRRGYEAADVMYLTAFGPEDPNDSSKPFRDADGDGLNDADRWATLENLETCLTGEFVQRSGRLLVLMISHGHRTDDFMAFRVNESQVLPSTTLDAWLDALQEAHAVDVTLAIDSCYSGQIVQDCRGAPTGRRRTVIASTDAHSEAVFLAPPDMTSFMYLFLSSAYMGNSIGEAWRAGQRFFQAFPVASQAPQLDDGTTGTARADREFFGATWAYGVQSTQDVNDFFPVFDTWTTHTTVSPGEGVRLWARMLPGQAPREVVAVVRPPAPEVLSGDPVTNLPHVSLQRKSDDPVDPDYRLWEAVDATSFADFGQYVVSFTARFDYERVSNPVFARITVSEGFDPDTAPIRAILALGDTLDLNLSSAFEGLGPYAYSVYLDRFQDDEGVRHPEWIEYLTPFGDSDRDGAPRASAVLSAVSAVPLDAGRLYVHLIGENAAAGEIRMSTRDELTASALDAALDELQSRQDCAVALAIDALGSGAFLPICKATAGQERVVLTSGRASDAALFLPGPTLTSFSQKFLSAAYQGANLRDSFLAGEAFFRRFLRYFLASHIYPQMDDDGDGLFNPTTDGELARTLYLGRRYAFAGDDAAGLPFILDVTSTRTVAAGAPVAFSVRLIEGVVPTRVFAQLGCETAPGSDEAIPRTPSAASFPEFTDPVRVEFTRDGPGAWTWSATFPAPATTGVYALIVYASYPDAPQEKLSEPALTALIVSEATPTPTPETIGAVIDSFYNLVLGREAGPGEADGWLTYFDYVVDFNIDVRFIPREMARLFFLSEEYAARNRTDSEFITDCYRVFLSRDPNQNELDNWLAGVWNRSQVMTVFSESEEFANRIAAMYPGLEGGAARNLVTCMYIGLLDRLVDKDGLEYAAGLFEAAYAEQAFVAQPPSAVTAGGGLVAQPPPAVAIQESDPGGGAGATRKRSGIEAVRAQAKQMAREVIVSPEFLGKQPTTGNYVVRFYRAFLGRFPNDAEIAYWSGELDSGRQDADGLINLFAGSVEFTARLEGFFG